MTNGDLGEIWTHKVETGENPVNHFPGVLTILLARSLISLILSLILMNSLALYQYIEINSNEFLAKNKTIFTNNITRSSQWS